jgi:hypothetical protein
MEGFIGEVVAGGLFRIIFPANLNGKSCTVEKLHDNVVFPINFSQSVGNFFIIEGTYDQNIQKIICSGGRQLLTH